MSEEATSESADIVWYRDFVAHRRWQRGKADPSHEYTVREWDPEREDDFERAVALVRSLGEPGEFWATAYTYLHVDGMKYWTMGSTVSATTVLNRAEP
jgi:hypothetical protein